MDKHNIKSVKSVLKSAFKDVKEVIKSPTKPEFVDSLDGKYFQKGKVHELRSELIGEKGTEKNPTTRVKVALKKIIANMSMGYDMSSLFAEVVSCLTTPNLEIKKMVYLFMICYGKQQGELALLAVNSFLRVKFLLMLGCL